MPILRGSLMIKEGGGVLIHFVSESSPEIFVLCDTVFVCEQQNKLCINLKRAYSFAAQVVLEIIYPTFTCSQTETSMM